MMIQNNRFLPPSPLPHSLLPRGRRQGRYVPFSANHTNGTTYDFLGQLIAAGYSNTGLTDESYSYDSNGNRITANGSNYTTGSNNELTSDGSWTYTYDDEGNRVSKTNSTHRELYEWDYRNRLTKVTQQEYNSSTEEWQDVQIVEYTYDYNNIWIRKLLDTNGDGTPDSKSIFIPENYQTTVQIDDGIVTHHYLWTPNQQDKLLADTTSTDVLWSLTDHLGTIRDVLGTTSTHLIYDAFGNLTSGTNPLLFGYTGKAFDTATNLQNNINRWYDATTGRWLSIDPIEFGGNDINLYRYVNNEIVKYNDNNGLEKCSPDEIPKRRDLRVTRIWFQLQEPSKILDLLTAQKNANILALFQSVGGITTGSAQAIITTGKMVNALPGVVKELPSLPGNFATINGIVSDRKKPQKPSNNVQSIPTGYDKKWLDGLNSYINAIGGFNIWFQIEYKTCECSWFWGYHYVTHKEIYLASKEWTKPKRMNTAPSIAQLQKLIDSAIEKYRNEE